MSVRRTRLRGPRPARAMIYLATVAILGIVPFAGTAFADDDDARSDDPVAEQPAREQEEPDDDEELPDPDQEQPTQEPDLPDNIVAGTPCTNEAIACVSLGANKAWLFEDGVITHGPVAVNTGGPGKETPVGDFVVEWKNKNHRSSEFLTPPGCKAGTPGCQGAPMNWAVFFAEGGIAFHEGKLNQRSAGCVRLAAADSAYYYNALQLGDKVEVRG
ncbi:MAG TPA: L,D-transpeptidase [Pseudonocardia sp.]|jgi:hypothetical protein|uniref:L,D-transpeptidase n=1 Tax=Pseudonocardia sp. TaxID=60912 RepID=UPI002BAB87BE|nr:L,D-transpeptidase [Pseudonocardia sp.]HTF54418.1 L,D-transpeptidase [Pseudonocardia sp.]